MKELLNAVQEHDHRIALFLALCKVQDAFSVLGRAVGQNPAHRVWKSKAHHPEDHPMFDGLFVIGIDVEEGRQLSYHLPLYRWDEANFEELEHAPKWDGHMTEDVLDRLKKL